MWLSFIEWVFKNNNEITVKQKNIIRARYPREGKKISSTDLAKSFKELYKDEEGFSKATIDREIEKVRECWELIDDVAGVYRESLQNWLQVKLIEYKETLIFSPDPIEHKKSLIFSTVPNDSTAEYIELCTAQLLDVPMLKVRDELSGEFQQEVAARQNIVGLEYPEGVVPLNSKFYMDLDNILEQCQQTIIHPSALLRIQAPRQMGKTSLLARIVEYAEGLDYRIARVDFQCADLATLQDLDSLLQWLCQEVCDRLGLEIVVAENWKNGGGSKRACTKFFQEHLLKDIDRPLLLSLDNLERIFENPTVGDDFGSWLRSRHEEGKGSILWSQLRIIILHTWYIDQAIHNSPFNVGRVIRLTELTIERVQELVYLHALDWDHRQTQQLTDLVGFHPFLIRLALYHVAIGETSLSEILERGYLADGLYNTHLNRYWRYLERYPELREIMAQVVKSETSSIIRSTLIEQLQDAGLVKRDGDLVLPANQLYRLYFRNRL
jgi:AAA-like domain